MNATDVLFCSDCRLEFEAGNLRDPATCPECGSALESRTDQCDHHDANGASAWVKLGRDRDGEEWWQCKLCGETNQ